MKPELFARVRELFDRLVDRPPDEQAAALAELEGVEDSVVLNEVRRLLDLGDGARETLIGAPTPPPELDRTGQWIGHYRLIRKLGEGGMGEVWAAEQKEPVERTVALKVIRGGLDQAEILGRFEDERQTLALMSHPNVARVLDAGTDGDGRPYFVMEYIDGIPLTAYGDRERLSLSQRLELFVDVCRGVQHAHQKGIIHRDLKPSNILVETQDGRPVPRIIDFGVAKATRRTFTDRTRHTQLGQLVGTPEYMSPEQANLESLDIDTRSDVYSLGVLLYEMVVGRPPFDVEELLAAGYDEMRRRIREEEPSRPSTRLSLMGDESTRIAHLRRVEASQLTRVCKTDLDWIALKALEKDRNRRYDSAAAFAEDVLHFLHDEPVAAGPPSISYRASKFVRRHRLPVTAAAAVTVALIAAVVGTGWGWVTARRAEQVALAAEAEARLEAETTSQVAGFLEELFRVSAPERALGKQITARELLDRGAQRIEEELTDQPELQGRLLETMGRAYRSLGLNAEARPLLERAVAERRLAHGDHSPEVAAALNSLAGLLILQGAADEALPLLEEATEIQRDRLDADDPERARTLNNHGTALRLLRRHEEALEPYSEALGIRERAFGPESLEVAKQLVNVGSLQRSVKQYDASLASYERALAIRRRELPARHPDVAALLNNMATLFRQTERLDDAERALDETLAIQQEVLGEDHPRLATTLANLGAVHLARGDAASARPLLERSLAIAGAKLRGDHPLVRPTTQRLIDALERLGDDAEAAVWRERLEDPAAGA